MTRVDDTPEGNVIQHIMQDNKHYRADKDSGFWDFVTKDPGDYEGRHRSDGLFNHSTVMMDCRMCVDRLSN